MNKFSIVESGGSKRDLPYIIKELRQKNLISGTEKDAGGETVYITHNLVAVRKVLEDYDGFMLDVHRDV